MHIHKQKEHLSCLSCSNIYVMDQMCRHLFTEWMDCTIRQELLTYLAFYLYHIAFCRLRPLRALRNFCIVSTIHSDLASKSSIFHQRHVHAPKFPHCSHPVDIESHQQDTIHITFLPFPNFDATCLSLLLYSCLYLERERKHFILSINHVDKNGSSTENTSTYTTLS